MRSSIRRIISSLSLKVTFGIGASLAAFMGLSDAQAATPNGRYLIILELGPEPADIGLQLVTPDLNNAASLPLNRVRPTIYDTHVNLRPLSGSGYGYYQYFPVLKTLYDAGNLKIVQNVGIDNLPPSPSQMSAAFGRGNPDANSGPQSGWLQRLGASGLRSYDIIDLSGGSPITAGGPFRPVALNQLLQLSNVDYYNKDQIFYRWESGLRRDMFFQIVQKIGANPNAETDEAQAKFAEFAKNDPAIRKISVVPQNYQGGRAGMFFRDAEMAIRFSREAQSPWSGGAQIIYGRFDDPGWASYTNQIQNGGDFQGAVQELNTAIAQLRTNTLNDLWSSIAVLVFTSGARSANENLQKGTNISTGANAMLVFGGAVNGGLTGAAQAPEAYGSKSGVLPRLNTATDVFYDFLAGGGYQPASIFPGYSASPLGLLK